MENNEPRVAVVSGGSRGIGRAVVLRLAQDGYDVGFCYQSNEEAARRLEKEVQELGGKALAVRADVSDGASVRSFVEDVQDALGPIGAAVTSAGITRDNPLLMMPDEDWDASCG